MSSATVRTTWTVLVPSPSSGAGTTGGGRRLARDLVPAHAEVVGDVGDRRALDPHADVVPAELAPGRVAGGVEAVAGLVGQVDAVDERDLVVDDDRLLVVAVDRVLARVAVGLDLRVARQVLDLGLDLLARRVEERDRRAGPDHDAHVDPLGQLGQQRADRQRVLAADQLEVRREVPAGQVDVRARAAQRLGDRGSAVAPSTSTSSAQPARGGGSPVAHSASSPRGGGSSTPPWPSRRSRRRWWRLTVASTAAPSRASARATGAGGIPHGHAHRAAMPHPTVVGGRATQLEPHRKSGVWRTAAHRRTVTTDS